MPSNFRPYQFTRPQTIATEVTHRKHLAALGMLKDISIPEVIQRFGTENDDVNFDTLISNQKTEYFDDDRPFSWQTIGRRLKRCELKEARLMDGTVIDENYTGGPIGVGGEHFFLVFRTKLFHFGELLIGRMRSHYQMQIVQQPISEGSDTVYEVQLVTGNDTGMQKDLLYSGEQFTYEYSLAESEGSNPRGGIRAQTMSRDRSEWTTIRKDKTFTGRADRQQAFLVDIPVVTSSGQKGVYHSWFDLESEIFREEWKEEKSRVRLFARSNRTASGLYLNLGESGNVEKQGDGFIAQIERGNVGEYNGFGRYFSLEPMVNMLTKAVIEGKVPLNRRKWVVVTGAYGMKQASQWIESQTKGWTQLEISSTLGIVNRVSSKDASVALGYGAQFTTYRAPMGIELNFMVDAQLDDPDRNMEPGPDGIGTMSSHVYYIMDLGNEAFPNFVNCRLKDTKFEDEFFYVIGARNPWGFSLPNNLRAHGKDESSMGVMATFGGYVRDPYRCLVYKPSGYVLG